MHFQYVQNQWFTYIVIEYAWKPFKMQKRGRVAFEYEVFL